MPHPCGWRCCTPMSRVLLVMPLLVALSGLLTAQTGTPRSTGEFSYIVRPAFGFLLTTTQQKDREAHSVSMTGQLRSQMSFDIGAIHFKSYLNANLAREAYSDASPRTMRDDLVFTAIPSVHVSDEYRISLFLELTMETRMTNGSKDGQPTSFMDPAFFYQTLYLGQWLDWKSDDKSQRLSARYGVGYAFQQTMSSGFLLVGNRAFRIDPENPLSAVRQARSVKLESGYSAVAALEYSNDISDNLSAFFQTLGVALSKGDVGSLFKRAHAVWDVGAGITYKTFSFRYDLRLSYDPNYSLRRQLDQSASFGIQLEFKD
jgi:hypothetical protein